MARRKDSPRSRRRALARATEKLARDRLRLATLEAGGAPERPIEVGSASLVEPRAASLACAACGGRVRIEEHAAEVVDGVRLRVARVLCDECHVRRSLWFRIAEESLVN